MIIKINLDLTYQKNKIRNIDFMAFGFEVEIILVMKLQKKLCLEFST